jgi:hypothetical protein
VEQAADLAAVCRKMTTPRGGPIFAGNWRRGRSEQGADGEYRGQRVATRRRGGVVRIAGDRWRLFDSTMTPRSLHAEAKGTL